MKEVIITGVTFTVVIIIVASILIFVPRPRMLPELTEVELKGHIYLKSSRTDRSGIVHAEHCPCKTNNFTPSSMPSTNGGQLSGGWKTNNTTR